LKNAKLKFTAFEKKEKFYESSKLMLRLIRHLKFVSLKNVPRVLSNLIFGSKKDHEDLDFSPKKHQSKQLNESELEILHRKMLFGKK